MPAELTTAEANAGISHGIEKYLARQPIFDRREAVFGYELLLRSSLENFFKPLDPGRVSELQVDNYLLFGLETLTGGRRAFVNFNREALVRDYAFLLPRERIVVEILEDVHPDADVIAACQRLKHSGYLIALDDFVPSGQMESLVSFANIVKVDFLRTSDQDRRMIAKWLAPLGIKLLAEKIEHREDIGSALETGYSLFQGFFYCKPQVLTARDIPGFRPNYARMLRAVSRRELNLLEIEQILKQEPSLLYKLLRYLNSAYFYLCQEVTSIRHALALLGEDNIRRWTYVVALVDLAKDKPDELVVVSLVRARFCELLAPRLGLRNRETDLFLLGLLSAMEAIVGREMAALLEEVPLAEDVKEALTGTANRFRCVLDITLGYERGDWQQVHAAEVGLGLGESQVPDLYLQSVEWTRRIYRN
jgi:EAL and modified HD-GYP domain-containing signal transduction protein